MKYFNNNFCSYFPIKEFQFEIAFLSTAHLLLPVLLPNSGHMKPNQQTILIRRNVTGLTFRKSCVRLTLKFSDLSSENLTLLCQAVPEGRCFNGKFMPALQCTGPGKWRSLPRWQQCSGRAKQAPPSLRGAWKVSSPGSDYVLYEDTRSRAVFNLSASKILFLLR